MHLIIVPSTLIETSIVCLEEALALTDTFPVLAFVFVSRKIKSVTQAISWALVEHSLIAKIIFEKHGAYTVHLSHWINLSIVYVAIIETFYTINPLN